VHKAKDTNFAREFLIWWHLWALPSWASYNLEGAMLIPAKRFIKTVGKIQMVFISEGRLPKASGARKTW
jgi:hypothetical protein